MRFSSGSWIWRGEAPLREHQHGLGIRSNRTPGQSTLLIDDFALKKGKSHLHVVNLRGGDFEEIPVQDNQVGSLADVAIIEPRMRVAGPRLP